MPKTATQAEHTQGRCKSPGATQQATFFLIRQNKSLASPAVTPWRKGFTRDSPSAGRAAMATARSTEGSRVSPGPDETCPSTEPLSTLKCRSGTGTQHDDWATLHKMGGTHLSPLHAMGYCSRQRKRHPPCLEIPPKGKPSTQRDTVCDSQWFRKQTTQNYEGKNPYPELDCNKQVRNDTLLQEQATIK